MGNESESDTGRIEVRKPQGREAQRADALRANLLRRKTQTRERAADQAPESDSDA